MEVVTDLQIMEVDALFLNSICICVPLFSHMKASFMATRGRIEVICVSKSVFLFLFGSLSCVVGASLVPPITAGCIYQDGFTTPCHLGMGKGRCDAAISIKMMPLLLATT